MPADMSAHRQWPARSRYSGWRGYPVHAPRQYSAGYHPDGKYPTKWVNLARKCGTLPSILDKTAFHQVHLLSNL